MLRVSARLVYFKSRHFHKKLFRGKIVVSTIVHRPSTNLPVRFELLVSACYRGGSGRTESFGKFSRGRQVKAGAGVGRQRLVPKPGPFRGHRASLLIHTKHRGSAEETSVESFR